MTLDRLLREMLNEWELSPTADPILRVASIVQPVTDRDKRRLMLKVVEPDPETRGEIPALQVWKGVGAVELMRADPRRGVLLLETLDRSLTEEPTDEAYAQIARLCGVLHRPASPKLPSSYALVAGWLDDLAALGRNVPAPPRFVEQALRAGRQLIAGEPTHVIHGDLHDENVMWRARTNEWVTIDPKGFNGDPCYEPASMLWNRWDELEWYGNPGETLRDRFYALVDGAGFDERRSRDWVVVRAVINISWAVHDARRERRDLSEDEHTWITQNITLAKAMQDVRP